MGRPKGSKNRPKAQSPTTLPETDLPVPKQLRDALPALTERVATQQTHSVSPDPNADYTDWPWTKVPYWVLKAARSGNPRSGNVVKEKIECVECKRFIWTCDKVHENMCEECEYVAYTKIVELRRAQAKRSAGRLVNPFTQTNHQPNFWPK